MSAQGWQRDPSKAKAQKGASPTNKVTVGRVLKYMYAPRLGGSFGEIGRNNGIFTRIIANIFVMQGLFPRHHPALQNQELRLTLGDVVGTAYRNLRWTKEGLPQILFFFAVLGTMILSTIGFIITLANIFVGSAHAGITCTATGGGIFTAPCTEDIGDRWLSHIFTANPFQFTRTDGLTTVTYGVGGGLMPTAIRAMAAQYSNAMLLLASIILIYHLISMVVATAHEGITMGRSANQIWAPVRLVFALGLLVPVGASGWSSGQWLVAWIAARGSGLASRVWGNFGQDILNQSNALASTPNINGIDIINKLERIGMCIKQEQYDSSADGHLIINGPLTPTVTMPPPGGSVTAAEAIQLGSEYTVKPITGVADLQAGAPNQWYIAGAAGGQWWAFNSCGRVTTKTDDLRSASLGVTLSAADINNLKSQSDAYTAAFLAVEPHALQLGATIQAGHLRTEGGGGFRTFPYGGFNYAEARKQLADLFRTTYLASITPAPGAGVDPGPCQYTYDGPTQQLTYGTCTTAATPDPRGWMVAGAYFLNIATQHTMAKKLSAEKLDVTSDGDAESATGAGRQIYPGDDGLLESQSFHDIQNAPGTAVNSCGLAEVDGEEPHVLVANCMMRHYGLLDANRNMQTGRIFSGVNKLPFSDMIAFGHKLVNIAIDWMKMGLALTAANIGVTLAKSGTGKVGDLFLNPQGEKAKAFLNTLFKGSNDTLAAAQKLLETGSMFAPFFIALGVLTFAPGFLLFYLLPALPFINFGLGIITWLMSLLQAVIAIPVIAIAHITPHGEGLPSQTARGAYFMLLQIFLRPIMMVIGLFIAVMLINTGLTFISLIFIEGINTSMVGDSIMDNLIYFVLYASICYGIVHAASTAIDQFPLRSTAWIAGGSVDQDHHHGNSVAGLLAGQQLMAQTQNLLGSFRLPPHFAKDSDQAQVDAMRRQIRLYRQAELAEGVSTTSQRNPANPAPGPAGAAGPTLPSGPPGSSP